MKAYQIIYDLRNKRDYRSLKAKLESYGYWARPLESCWIIATEHTAEQIMDNLTAVMDNDDGILVTRLQGEAAWQNLDFDHDGVMTKWLKDNLSKAA